MKVAVNAVGQVAEIIATDGFGLATATDGTEWIIYRWGSQAICYTDAVAAEEAHPANVEDSTGWLFGDGATWVNLIEVTNDSGPSALETTSGNRYNFAI